MGAFKEPRSWRAGRLVLEDLEAYGICVSDDDAQRSVTVGDLVEIIASKDKNKSRDDLRNVVVQTVSRHFEVEPSSVSAATDFVKLGRELDKNTK